AALAQLAHHLERALRRVEERAAGGAGRRLALAALQLNGRAAFGALQRGARGSRLADRGAAFARGDRGAQSRLGIVDAPEGEQFRLVSFGAVIDGGEESVPARQI